MTATQFWEHVAQLILRHEHGHGALLRGSPCRIRIFRRERVSNEYSGNCGLRRTRVLLQVTQNDDVVDQGGGLEMKFADALGERTNIARALSTRSCASLCALMTVMERTPTVCSMPTAMHSGWNGRHAMR